METQVKVPENKNLVLITFQIPKEDSKRLKRVAIDMDTTVSNLIRTALQPYLIEEPEAAE